MGPDVNESDLTFTVNKDGNIRFGLAGVKGVGEGAVLSIIDERNKNGKFQSVFDFIERVNLSSCNKKTIESLALCGAFDSFSDIKREQFFIENSKGEIVMEAIIRYGNKYQLDMAMTKNSLFGETDAIEIAKPEIPYAPEWSPLEKLNKERDLIGMYLSAHPLDEFEFQIKHVCTANTADLKDLPSLEGKVLRIGGMVTNLRHGTSKAGNPYGIFTLEDYKGAFEFALFGNNYVEYRNYMIKDLYLFITALVQEKGADYKFKKPTDPNLPKEIELKIQKIDLFRNIKDSLVQKITFNIPLQRIDEDFVVEMTDIILGNKGDINVFMHVFDENSPNKVKLFSRNHRMQIDPKVYHQLTRLQELGYLEFQVN